MLLALSVSPLMQDYDRAWVLTGQLKYAEAIPILKSIIARDKTFTTAHITAWWGAYTQQGLLPEAKQYFEEARAQSP